MDKLICDECGDEFDGDTTETLCDDCAWDEAEFEDEDSEFSEDKG